MNDSVAIRPACTADADALAALLDELGYPANAAQVGLRLARFTDDAQAIALVACRSDSLCGLATAHAHYALNRDEPSVQLSLLVIAATARSSGVGRALVAAAEAWAEQHGARRLVVTTASHRDVAHAFYERLGYLLTGRRYARTW
ncbi:MAG: GNAT family N-acetyltransferase [Rhodanobacteraceae bacterium]|nr:GNAT family N-acetyltransferase [Rhodanobacteraceae bacterium]